MNEIYNEDCFDVMKRIPDGSIDLIVTDPPYNMTDCSWDKPIDYNLLCQEFKRICNGVICIFGVPPFSSNIIIAMGAYFKYELIWDKIGATGFVNANKRPLRLHENISVFFDRNNTYNPQKYQGKPYTKRRTKNVEAYSKINKITTNNNGLMNPTSIIRIPKESCVGSNEFRAQNCWHPTQKPVDLYRYLINTYSHKGDVIFDAFSGSGTFAVAAIKEGRKYIGCELNKQYFERSLERINNQQNELF